MSHGKTIRIYLADGSPTGIRHAELVNWTGQAIVCPRARIGELAAWEESKRPGVYVLFGEDETATKPRAYIGEAENVLDRLQSHIKNKDFWDRVVLFTSKDANLTKAHVKYLEARFIQLAIEAARMVLENGNAPQLPALPRPDRDAMEDFLEPARILLSALGFPLLQPLVKKASIETSGKAGPLASIRLFFKVPKLGVDAQGAATDEGFVVFAGSLGAARIQDYLNQGWKDRREELQADGSLVVERDNVRFTRDVLFSSASAAAAIVCGGSRNGREVWKTKTGKTLKVLEEELTGAEPGKAQTSDG
ncbi:MAG TPA: GIY-YIG nuclease family protein [Myxococcota bacterium]|nr:GIY-YIG nuclease family protein [Myxococcota bacterium]HQK50409.1 GIY-YIG nuclease family protein [Myxococcota bacterium]